MDFTEKDFKKFLILGIFLVMAILVFMIVRPLVISIISGLILAYLFTPLYKFILKRVRSKNLAATLVCVVALTIVAVPLWFIIPLIIQQMFEVFRYTQALDIQHVINTLFPASSDSFKTQISANLNGIVSKITSAGINSLSDFIFNLPTFVIGLFVSAFVFFFSMRDSKELGEFVSAVSPINKSKEKVLVDQFTGVTDSILYGYIIVGVIQGLLAGLGFFIFGVDNALVLTILAVLLSIIPFTGAFFIWLPVSIYMFATANPTIALIFFLYNVLFVSTIDNFLRAYIVSKKTDLSQAIVIIGMIGGLFVYGILGIVIGPLILAYLITFLKAYREKSLYSLFTD